MVIADGVGCATVRRLAAWSPSRMREVGHQRAEFGIDPTDF